MFLRLRLPAFARIDDEHARRHATHAGQHVGQEPHVARHVDEAQAAPDGRSVWAKPRSIVSPRRFSSSSRSGSVPVRASTSDDFPWSTCPAVAMTVIGPAAPAPASAASKASTIDVVVRRVDGAQVEHRRRRHGRCAITGRRVGAQRRST